MPILESPTDEAKRIIEVAQQKKIILRLFGGVSFYFRCPSAKHRSLQRNYVDIDFMGHAKQSKEIKQLFEERLRRPMGSPAVTSFGSGALQFGKQRKFWFQLDAELIVYGATEPTAKVTLQGEPIKLRPDGTFTMRFSLPDSRQIIPAVAASADGVEERTIVLAVERNTKQLEPVIHDGNEG